MERLSQSDLDKVRDFLEATSAPCNLAEFSARILPATQNLVPGDIICLSETNKELQESVTFDVYPSGAHIDTDLFDLYMFDHPIFQHWDRVAASPTVFTSGLVPMRRWHHTALYQTVYRTLGLEDSLAFGLPSRPGLVACICIERHGLFSDHDRALLEMVRPYVAQLYRNAEAYSLLGAPAGDNKAQSMLLDHSGRPLLAPEEAWDVIFRYFPAPVDEEAVFPPPLSGWLQLQLARSSPKSDIPDPPMPLIVSGEGGGTLTLRLIPGAKTGEQALLLLQERRPASDAIVPEFGLSEREKEVLLLARQGLRNADIADRLNISRRTVEKHFDNVYYKLGVENRTAAIAHAFHRGEV